MLILMVNLMLILLNLNLTLFTSIHLTSLTAKYIDQFIDDPYGIPTPILTDSLYTIPVLIESYPYHQTYFFQKVTQLHRYTDCCITNLKLLYYLPIATLE